MNLSNEQLEFQKDFLSEAGFLIEQCEESFLSLEHSEGREEELAKIYRVIHTFKGAGAAVGFKDLAEFTHIVEDALSILRVNPDLLNSEIITILLKVGDALKKRITYLTSGQREEWQIEALQSEVTKLREKLKSGEMNTVRKTPGVGVRHEMSEQKAERVAGVTQVNSATTVKVDTERIENVLNAVGELVVIKSQLFNELEGSLNQNPRLGSVISLLDRTIRDLQDKALSMRMTPLKSTFLKLHRIVRDLSIRLSKPVDFKMEGEDVEMDRTMVEVMGDPLMHIIRNSLDHGIERSEIRVQKGKTPQGTVTLSARVSGGRVVILIKDDGGGINRNRILEKAMERGLIVSQDEANSLSDSEVFQLIFEPGFSTAEVVTDVSGRGVGMDVAKTSIEKLRGHIQIESTLGVGTTFTLSLPMTTSITDGMLVQVNNHPFILPIDGIKELVDSKEATLSSTVRGEKVLKLRDKFFQVIDLHSVFSKVKMDNVCSSAIVLVEHQTHQKAILVDKVIGQAQVVQKPLSHQLADGVSGLSGAAILGDGRVALVIDVESLFQAGVA